MIAGIALTAALLGLGDKRPNILVTIIDDVGRDVVDFYGVGAVEEQPPTPSMDSFATKGITFRNFWSMATCSPTRACFLTGRYPSRHGLGAIVIGDSITLSEDEYTLAEALRDDGYTTALLGKWHLGWKYDRFTPQIVGGFDWFSGTRGNIGDFFQHTENVTFPGTSFTTRTTSYDTTWITDLAISAISSLPEPWFVVVSYHAAHKPLHVPPQELHSQGEPTDKTIQFLAMVEALDTEFGRLLDAVDLSDTTAVLMGDNGPVSGRTQYVPAGRGKSTTFEGGLNVPMVVAGYGVNPRHVGVQTEALVDATDFYATLLGLAGVRSKEALELDSVNFAPVLRNPWGPSPRSWIYAERLKPVGLGPWNIVQVAIREADRKLRIDGEGDRFLYDMTSSDPDNAQLCGPACSGFNTTPADQARADALQALLESVFGFALP